MAVCGEDIKGTRLKKEHYSQSLRIWQIFTPHRGTANRPTSTETICQMPQPLTPKINQSEKGTRRMCYTEIKPNLMQLPVLKLIYCHHSRKWSMWRLEIDYKHLHYIINEERKCFNLHIKADLISDKEWVSFLSVREYISQAESLKWNDILKKLYAICVKVSKLLAEMLDNKLLFILGKGKMVKFFCLRDKEQEQIDGRRHFTLYNIP